MIMYMLRPLSIFNVQFGLRKLKYLWSMMKLSCASKYIDLWTIDSMGGRGEWKFYRVKGIIAKYINSLNIVELFFSVENGIHSTRGKSLLQELMYLLCFLFQCFFSFTIFSLQESWVQSFSSLEKLVIDVDVEIQQDCYESFSMYYFGRYIIACLGREERNNYLMKRQGHSDSKTPLLEPFCENVFVKEPFPLNYFFKPWRLRQWFVKVAKFGIVQYMVINPIYTIIEMMIESFSVYGEGDFKWYYRYNWRWNWGLW